MWYLSFLRKLIYQVHTVMLDIDLLVCIACPVRV